MNRIDYLLAILLFLCFAKSPFQYRRITIVPIHQYKFRRENDRSESNLTRVCDSKLNTNGFDCAGRKALAMAESIQYGVYASILATLIPSSIILCLRFVARKLKRVSLWWDDYLAVLALVCLLKVPNRQMRRVWLTDC